MFRKKIQSYDANSYRKFLNNILKDKNTIDEIVVIFNLFLEDGKINFDGNNLYGKIIKKKGNEYLEIKYENGIFICNYTDWNCRKIINIVQTNLKNGNTKLEKKETENIICNNNENQTTTKELEKIYDSKNKLIYESSINIDHSFDALNDSIVYKDNCFFVNLFELERKWYIANGSIIRYTLSKRYMDKNSNLKENYFVCPNSYTNNGITYYNFVNLDENLFNAFMSNEITIEELLKQNDEIMLGNNKIKQM